MNGQLQKPLKKDSKKEPSSSKATSKRKPNDGDKDGSKKRKQKKKKDPNAPKRAMSGFMFFSQMEREVSLILILFLWNVKEKYDFILLVWMCCQFCYVDCYLNRTSQLAYQNWELIW